MRPWNTIRATGYGAVIGFAAGAFKLLAPWSVAPAGPAMAKELLGAALAFALLCAGAAALRNFIVRRLLGSGIERR